jgi:hypothetical protein
MTAIAGTRDDDVRVIEFRLGVPDEQYVRGGRQCVRD